MSFQLFSWLKPAEGEDVVRTYHTTTLKSRLLSMNAEGFLVVTNKRVVFHAFGSSISGDSVLQSEVPVEDVSGITCYSGAYFSFLHLIGAFLLSLFGGMFVNTVLLGTVMGFFFSLAEFDSIDTYLTASKALLWVFAIGSLALSFTFSRDRVWRSFLVSLSTIFLADLGGLDYFSSALGSFFTPQQSGGEWILLIAFIVGIYAFVCMFWYGRRLTMSLAVGSKGGASTPIAISGVRSFGLADGAATRALSAEPAEDAETMIKQLGAMITDIQTLGDFGIEKWKTV